MKPIEEIAYDVPQFLKDRAAGLSIEEQAKLYNLTSTEMEMDAAYQSKYHPSSSPVTKGILESGYVLRLLVCDGILVGFVHYVHEKEMFFDKDPSFTYQTGSTRYGGDYYAFIVEATEFTWSYTGEACPCDSTAHA